MKPTDFLAIASAALNVDVEERPRKMKRRGTGPGADVRRLCVVLAVEAGRTRRDAAQAAGLTDHSTASYHVRVHRDLMETEPTYRAAYERAQGILAMITRGGEGVAAYGRAYLPGEGHRIHATTDGLAICGTPIPGARQAGTLRVGPPEIIGLRADQDVLHVSPTEVGRFVTCGHCLRILMHTP